MGVYPENRCCLLVVTDPDRLLDSQSGRRCLSILFRPFRSFRRCRHAVCPGLGPGHNPTDDLCSDVMVCDQDDARSCAAAFETDFSTHSPIFSSCLKRCMPESGFKNKSALIVLMFPYIPSDIRQLNPLLQPDPDRSWCGTTSRACSRARLRLWISSSPANPEGQVVVHNFRVLTYCMQVWAIQQ